MFLKNYLERASEAINIPGLTEGQYLLNLKANDLDIYPLICAEFTSQQAAGKPLARIRKHIESEASHANILITGIAFEKDTSHYLWKQGIRESVQLHQGKNIITVLVNNANNPCYSEETKDKWRCLSGVYTKRNDASNQQVHPPSRSIKDDDDLKGVVCRTGDSQAICGKISWDLRSSGDRFLWRTIHRSLTNHDGKLQEADLGNIHLDELKRLIRRYSPTIDCSAVNCVESVNCKFNKGGCFTDVIVGKCSETIVVNKWNCMNIVNQTLGSSELTTAKLLIESVLYGLLPKEKSPDMFSPQEIEYLERGLQVLGALKSRPSSEWHSDPLPAGQLIDNTLGVQILIWVDPSRRSRDIELAITEWSQNSSSGKSLLAVVHCCSGICHEGPVDSREGNKKSLRRANIGSPPLPEDRKGIEAHRLKKASIVVLGHIENCFHDTNLVHSVEVLLEERMQELV